LILIQIQEIEELLHVLFSWVYYFSGDRVPHWGDLIEYLPEIRELNHGLIGDEHLPSEACFFVRVAIEDEVDVPNELFLVDDVVVIAVDEGEETFYELVLVSEDSKKCPELRVVHFQVRT
jgi:hypothetical protein